jgi:signal transduction histidine kinase
MLGGQPQGQASSPEGMALRQLPVLFVALVITAWQYGLAGVIFFSGGTALLELLTVVLLAPLVTFVSGPRPLPPQGFVPIPFRTIDIFLVLTLVRTVSFVFVGLFISQLMGRLRAQQKSLTDANARLTHYASTLESLAVSRERNRLAHELHDTLAHSLTAIAVQLETVKAYWSLDRKKARQQLDGALVATRSGTEETRRALKALRASPLEELGLGLALRQLAESAAQRGRLALDLELPDQLPSLSPDVEQSLYRIAQEALENAVTHSGAQRLGLRLLQSGPAITLTVRDDGAGFDPARQSENDHFGLVGMRERARLSGGDLAIESQPGQGTTVTLRIGAAL